MEEQDLEKAKTAIVRAKIKLLTDYDFWGSKALKMDYIPWEQVGTACTDGIRTWYSPTFVNILRHLQVVFLLAHEVGHILLGHGIRRNGRDIDLSNDAADFAINYILRRCKVGEEIPGGLYPEKFDEYCKSRGYTPVEGRFISEDMSYEEWYAVIQRKDEEKKKNDQLQGKGEKGNKGDQSGSGSGSGKPGDKPELPGKTPEENAKIFGIGGVINTPEEGKNDPNFKRRADIVEALNASSNSGCGSIPQWLERKMLDEVSHNREQTPDDLLRDWLSEKITGDYSYAKPSYKSWYSRLILPGQETDAIDHVYIAIDTSGSINTNTLHLFKEILNELKEKYDFNCTVIYSDCEVHNVETFTRGEPIEFNPVGGGGTNFKPAFEYIQNEMMNEDIVGMIYFTDLDCSSYPEEPEYPVLWMTNSATRKPRFGDVIRLLKT